MAALLLHQLLDESAAKFPDRVAVAFEAQSLTYAQLDERATRLAWQLCSLGARPGDRVGIYLKKSIESVISIFGILKAGCCYVPVDPDIPAVRARYIIGNCAMSCLVTTPAKLADLAADDGARGLPSAVLVAPPGVASPPHAWLSVDPPTSGTLPRDGIDSDLAYILYTSGSTGEPKGVTLSHRHALSFVRWAQETFRITHEDRLSNHAPLHFDLSILDIFGAISSGACVILVPPGLSTFPFRLVEFIEMQQISIWYSVPSILTMMVLHGKLERFQYPRLRSVLFAGEVFPVKFLRQLMHALPNASFFNLYGPTETNVCTYYEVPPLPKDRVQPLPIGRACTNADVFALDEEDRLAPEGSEGELCVRGALITQGYWGDLKKSEAALRSNPLQTNFKEQIYRTGDIVVQDRDGNFNLVGRRDHLVKSRGYRIELGEIETVLLSHPGIREAVAIPVKHEVFGAIIRAVVVGSEELTPEALRSYCAARLPQYMVPEAIDLRSELPKTSTGKIDRQAITKQLAGGTA